MILSFKAKELCVWQKFSVPGIGGGVMGYVIRIIFDPNTRQWGGGGGSRVVIQM